MEKAFKFRIYPNKTQEKLIQKTFGCVVNRFSNISSEEMTPTSLGGGGCQMKVKG